MAMRSIMSIAMLARRRRKPRCRSANPKATPAVTTPDYTDYNPELGGGTDILYTNRSLILHPNGVAFLPDNITGETPTDAELADKANWALRFQHQNVRIGKIEIRADKLS